MRASITFLIIWFIFVALGFAGSVLMHFDERACINWDIWFQHDIIYALIIGWILSGLIILYLYGSSKSKKDKENKTTQNK